MKKIVLVMFMLSFFTIVSNAQGFRLGIKGGGNLNKISGQSFNDGFDFGYHLGAFAELDFTKKFGIQPELIWNQSSTKPSNFQAIYGSGSVSANFNGQNQVKLDYLSIPILLRYTVLSGLLTLNAGPQYSIMLQQDKTILQNGQAAFKNGDFAAVVGAQLNLSFLRIYGRYNIGLQNINDIDNKDNWKSQQIQFGIGLKL
jgi:hypothetical protein